MRVFTITHTSLLGGRNGDPDTYVEVYGTKEKVTTALKERFNIDMPDIGGEAFFEWQREEPGAWKPAFLFNEHGQLIDNGINDLTAQLFYEEHEVL